MTRRFYMTQRLLLAGVAAAKLVAGVAAVAAVAVAGAGAEAEVTLPALAASAASIHAVRDVAATGEPAPQLAAFDALVERLLQKYEIPGAALAVVKDGRLVLARGYGLADVDRREPVQPDSLFRIASLSKPFTSAAILTLVERGTLRLDDRAFARLGLGEPADPRAKAITIRELLEHAGGWNRETSFDPMFIPLKAANAVGATPPASCETVIRYMLAQPLQFAPGSAMHYSNFGYCVLGRVIEKVTGQRYEDYVRAAVLAPMGVTRMRLGHTLLPERAPGEVRYYTFPGASLVTSVFPSHPGQVPSPYGGWNLEAMDSHGGWIASPIDLVRFIVHLDGTLKPSPVKPAMVTEMIARPAGNLSPDPNVWYGLGWQVRRVSNEAVNWWHVGSLDGTTTLMVRTSQGMDWALLFNGSPRRQDQLVGEMDDGLWQAAGTVRQWPARDLFSQYR